MDSPSLSYIIEFIDFNYLSLHFSDYPINEEGKMICIMVSGREHFGAETKIAAKLENVLDEDLEEAAKHASLRELQEEKARCLERIKVNEENKADYQRSGYEWWVQDCETNIELWQQRVKILLAAPECKAYEAQLAHEAKVHEALTSVDKRDEFSLCTKEKSVSCNMLSGTMSGFTGSGKTHTLAMLTNQPPPTLRVSTPLNQIPTRTITQTRIGVDVKANFEKMSDEQYSKRVMVTAKASVAALVSGTSFKFKAGMHKIFSSKPSEPTDPVERELLLNLHMADDSVQSLEGHTVVEISDCGGQPQFIEMLPRYIESIDFSLVIFDLSLHFSDYPINCFFNSTGKSVGKGVPYSLNNEQVIRLSLQMIASRSQGDRQVKFAFVGTHRDLEGEYSEREVKNQRLREMVETFGLQDSVISKSRSEYIFAINAKNPEAVDHQTVSQLRDSILEKCPPHTINIPVSYHALELTVKRKAAETGHIAFDVSAMLKDLSNFHFSKKSLQEGLRYLHKNKRIFFYEKDFPSRFIAEPQAILNKQTELVVYNIQLSTNPDLQEQLDKEQWRFVKYGFLTISCLNKFPDHYVEGVFTPADMLKLFVKLLMISEVSHREYLMPCVLPTDPLADCNPEPDTQSVPPMVLHFPAGPARYGIFCGTICHLMTKSKWELEMDPSAVDEPVHIARNSVHFTLPGYRAKISINDPFDSFFVVTVHVPGDVSPYTETVFHLCAKVRDTLVDAITSVTKKLNYSPGTPKVAFLCTEHKDLHPATVAEVSDELLCTKVKNAKAGPLTPGHRVWLRDSSSKEPFPDLNPPQPMGPPSFSAKPKLHQLYLLKGSEGKHKRIMLEVAAEWEGLALLLEFEYCVIKLIKDDNSGKHGMTERCCQDMLARWLDGDACQPVTWGKLLEAIRDLPNHKLATEIEQLLLH